MSTAPPASTIILLRDVPAYATSHGPSKVRFLSTVQSYDIKTDTLFLSHPSARNTTAVVSLSMLTQDAPMEMAQAPSMLAYTMHDAVPFVPSDLLPGTLVNVIGYTGAIKRQLGSAHTQVIIQAIQLWHANGIDIDTFERAVAGRAHVII